MRKSVLIAVATVSLLGACRQPEQANIANDTSPVDVSSTATASPSSAPVSAETAQKIFDERHEGMEDIGDATKAIGQQLKSGSPDMAVIQKGAATIADLAPKASNWFPAGTNKDVLPKTRALPAIWEKPDDFAAKARDFEQAAQAFKAAADSGNLDAVKASFASLGKTCKACHDSYRAEEHAK
jgi:cytochrome c556